MCNFVYYFVQLLFAGKKESHTTKEREREIMTAANKNAIFRGSSQSIR